MLQQFTLSPELQQFVSGLQSKAVANVQFNIDFGDEEAPALPTNPNTVRRSLMFSKVDFTDEATPVEEYNCFIQNLDGTTETPVSVPREL